MHRTARLNIRDVMAVEATQQFRGLYHVLGGVISPMDGVGPGDLQIESLVRRVAAGGIKEVILALSTTMEGDTTNFYIYRKLEKMGVKLSVIARGISVGDELEYADEVTWTENCKPGCFLRERIKLLLLSLLFIE